jgi:predicted DNA-binding transcriptional regulator YafY
VGGIQLARQWKIIRLVESLKRGLAAPEISSEFDAPMRTIYRDLEALQQAGCPLYSYRIDKHAYWKLIEGFKSDLHLPFTTAELISLNMCRDILRIFDGTVFQECIESLFERVKKYIPPGFADSDLFEELSVCSAPPLKKDGYKIHQSVNRFLKGAQQN